LSLAKFLSIRERIDWRTTNWPLSGLGSGVPALVFGLRLWAAVSLALYIAFWLELDNAYWAGASAAVVCQTSLGASLRKGWFRLVGTTVGALAIVVLTACFPQQRICFLFSVALWAAACGFVASLLRNFGAYSAALAGYTAAIIATDELGAIGGANGEAFMLAVTRASEICIGILCASFVLIVTDLGGARRRLAKQLSAITAEIAGEFADKMADAQHHYPLALSLQHDLMGRIRALEPMIDETQGEASDLRLRAHILYAAEEGLFAVLSGWGIFTSCIQPSLEANNEGEQEAVYETLSRELCKAAKAIGTLNLLADLCQVRRSLAATMKALIALPASTPLLRLQADETARIFAGFLSVFDALELLVGDPVRMFPRRHAIVLSAPDWPTAFANAARTLIVICGIELFWVVTAWPNGSQAIAFAAIAVIVFSLKGDQAYSTAVDFMIGTCIAVALAALVKFAVLPSVRTFAGFTIVVGTVLVPAGALTTQPSHSAMFTALVAYFVPLLAPTNLTSYDPAQFYNTVLATVVGVGVGVLAFCLLPTPVPSLRTCRLLDLTLRDLRQLSTDTLAWSPVDWKHRVRARLAALPDATNSMERAQLLAALSVGTEIIRLDRIARRFNLNVDLAFGAVARGESSEAANRLHDVDRKLANYPPSRRASEPGFGRVAASFFCPRLWCSTPNTSIQVCRREL